MERALFGDHFETATNQLRSSASTYVVEHLPEPVGYLVKLACSFDGNPLKEDERTFPNDLTAPRPLGPLSPAEVIELLWRDGWVPEWIDMTVVAADHGFTTMELECCGRFTTGSQLYHQKWKPPFSIKIGPLPPDFKEGQRYSLYWRNRSTH